MKLNLNEMSLLEACEYLAIMNYSRDIPAYFKVRGEKVYLMEDIIIIKSKLNAKAGGKNAS